MKLAHLLLITMLSIGLLSGCSKEEPTPPPTTDETAAAPEAPAQPAPKPEGPTGKIGQKAASLDGLNYIKGDSVTFEEGKVYVVEFWATWCGPCRTSIPHLTEVQKQFKDKGVTIVGISNETDLEKVKGFVTEQGEKMDYIVAVDPERKVSDGYMKAFNRRGIPSAFVVDTKGNIAWVGHPMSGMDEVIAKVLDGTFDAVEFAAAQEAAQKAAAEKAAAEKAAAKAAIEAIPEATIGQKAASLDGLTFIKGDSVTLEEGKVYVVEFWATWCGPCRTSIPHLTEVQKKFKDKGVTIVGISDEKDIEKVKGFVTEQGEKMDYIVAVDPEKKVSDGYMTAYRQGGIPTAFIVDAKSNVVWVGHPMSDMEEVLPQVIDGTFDAQTYAKAKAEREAADQALGLLFQKYLTAVSSGAAIEATRPTAEEIIESDNPMALNALAWQILSMPKVDDANRDTEIALKSVEKANTIADGKDPMILDTYALALSKTGKLAEAVATQQKAVDLTADNERMQADMKIRLDTYKAALEAPAAE